MLKIFEKASKWIKKVFKEERMQGFSVMEQAKLKFNLSRTPLWGGQFERMVGLVRQCLYKATRKAKLTKEELERSHIVHRINLNNRPLMYIDDDIQFSVFTPNILIHGQPITILDEQFDDDDKVKSGNDKSNVLRVQPRIDETKSTCAPLEKDTI